ncbi:MAG: transketolase [Chthoniobacterales bacterium]|nr:transketolase [Chthoniobacterales bacterium]
MNLYELSKNIKFKIIQMSYNAKTPHLSSAISSVELLVAAYWNFLRINPKNFNDDLRDRFIFSKGHAAPALYVVLAKRGFFSEDLLESFGKPGGTLPEQPAPNCVPGVELATGSLGHGLPVGCGLALAAKIKGLDYFTMVLMSDGECNEGSVWEAAMFAAARELNNLIVVIDFNKWQATGRSEEIMALSPLREKWESFGWRACEVDGHNIEAITEAMHKARELSNKPFAIIAHTVKGKGISFMEDDNNWHYRIPNADEVEKARRELFQENIFV